MSEVKEEDPFLIFYTSGTTGTPRGALYTEGRNIESTRTKALQIGVETGDKHIMILPLFHIGGYSHFWSLLLCRGEQCDYATEILRSRSYPAIHSGGEGNGYSYRSYPFGHHAGSAQYREIRSKESKADLVCCLSHAYRVIEERDGEIWTYFHAGLWSVGVRARYHLFVKKISSSPGQVSWRIRRSWLHAVIPGIGVHVRIVDENNNDVEPYTVGEIVVQSKIVMVEYWHKPEETQDVMAKDGFTLAIWDTMINKGYIYIVDRKKDMIIYWRRECLSPRDRGSSLPASCCR